MRNRKMRVSLPVVALILGCSTQVFAIGPAYIPTGYTDAYYTGVDGGNWGSVPNSYFNNEGGATLSSLTVTPNGAIDANGTNLANPRAYCGGCGDDVSAYFDPTQTGYYTFAMASDDSGAVYLSTDATVANGVQIINTNGTWSNYQSYTDHASNFSAPILLTGGQSYYLEGIHAQGGGGMDYTIAVSYSSTLAGATDPANGTPGVGTHSQNMYGLITTAPFSAPEPASLSVLGMGAMGLLARRRHHA